MTHVRPRMSDLHKLFVCALTATALAGSITSAAFAQPDRRDGQDRGQQGQYDNHGNRDDRGEHRSWGQDRGGDYSYRRGQRMGYNDWHNAPVVDYRQRHLRRPRAGYEWREHNGKYVLVAIATGLIASVLLNQR